MKNPYDYPINVAVKFIILRDNKVLLLREPETNEWMPGRLGLPGGKLLFGESISEVIKRKIREEVGFEVKVDGLTRVVSMLMPQKSVYHFILLANHISGEIDLTRVEAADMRWYDHKQIEALGKDDFTEYYNENLLKQALSGALKPINITIFEEQDNRSGNVLKWMSNGQS